MQKKSQRDQTDLEASRPAQTPQQPQARNCGRRHRDREETLQPVHPRPRPGSMLRNAGMKATSRKGSARPSPSAANTAIDPAGGSSSAVPSARQERPGAGRSDERGKRARPEAARAGRALPPSTGISNRPNRFSVIATASSSSRRIVRGPEAGTPSPPPLPPRGRQAAPRRARPCRPPHRPCKLAHRARASPTSPPARERCNAFNARIGNTQGIRLSSIPPGNRAEDCPEDRLRAQLRQASLPPVRNRPRHRANLEARPVAEREHAAEMPRMPALQRLSSATSVSPRAGRPAAPHSRRRRRRPGRGRLADLDARRERDRDAHLVAGELEMAGRRQRPRQARRHSSNRARSGVPLPIGRSSDSSPLLGHADLVGAGEPVRLGADRHRALSRPPAPSAARARHSRARRHSSSAPRPSAASAPG